MIEEIDVISTEDEMAPVNECEYILKDICKQSEEGQTNIIEEKGVKIENECNDNQTQIDIDSQDTQECVGKVNDKAADDTLFESINHKRHLDGEKKLIEEKIVEDVTKVTEFKENENTDETNIRL